MKEFVKEGVWYTEEENKMTIFLIEQRLLDWKIRQTVGNDRAQSYGG